MVDSIGSGLGNLNTAQSSLQSAQQRISSGKQVNSAADNAAGLAIINRLTSSIDGASQAARNTSDGISLVQVAGASLSSITDGLQRIRELSLQAANGTLSDGDRASIQSEVGQLQEEISTSLSSANFNGVDLFAGEQAISIQVGAQSGDTIELPQGDLTAQLATIADIDVSTQSGATSALENIDNALQSINEQQGILGAAQNRFEAVIGQLDAGRINSAAARSRIEDADIAKQSSELIKASIQLDVGIALRSQANANAERVLGLLPGA